LAYQTVQWVPRTSLGKQVLEGKVTSIREVFEQNIPIKEPEIVDALLPEMKHEVLDVNIVQKQTDAGEITKFKIGVVIGNGDGFIGIGIGKSKQMRFAIDKAVADAKLNLTPVRRGCGNWECTCGKPHSLPYKVSGKKGSVSVTLIPAPKGSREDHNGVRRHKGRLGRLLWRNKDYNQLRGGSLRGPEEHLQV
jgi:small subunit ribosomal protein S5